MKEEGREGAPGHRRGPWAQREDHMPVDRHVCITHRGKLRHTQQYAHAVSTRTHVHTDTHICVRACNSHAPAHAQTHIHTHSSTESDRSKADRKDCPLCTGSTPAEAGCAPSHMSPGKMARGETQGTMLSFSSSLKTSPGGLCEAPGLPPACGSLLASSAQETRSWWLASQTFQREGDTRARWGAR